MDISSLCALAHEQVLCNSPLDSQTDSYRLYHLTFAVVVLTYLAYALLSSSNAANYYHQLYVSTSEGCIQNLGASEPV